MERRLFLNVVKFPKIIGEIVKVIPSFSDRACCRVPKLWKIENLYEGHSHFVYGIQIPLNNNREVIVRFETLLYSSAAEYKMLASKKYICALERKSTKIGNVKYHCRK